VEKFRQFQSRLLEETNKSQLFVGSETERLKAAIAIEFFRSDVHGPVPPFQVLDSGFLATAPSLLIQLMADDSYVQVRKKGVFCRVV